MGKTIKFPAEREAAIQIVKARYKKADNPIAKFQITKYGAGYGIIVNEVVGFYVEGNKLYGTNGFSRMTFPELKMTGIGINFGAIEKKIKKEEFENANSSK